VQAGGGGNRRHCGRPRFTVIEPGTGRRGTGRRRGTVRTARRAGGWPSRTHTRRGWPTRYGGQGAGQPAVAAR
jgi:hypothetical protein